MSTLGSPAKSYVDFRNINLKGGALGTGLIRWAPAVSGTSTLWSSNPFSSTDYGLYINAAGSLVFSSLGTTTTLGASGVGGVPTWEQIFAADTTFNVAGTTWTIDNSTGNNDVLTITNSGAGSGDAIQITNAGTGKDIQGTSNTWSVTKLGAGAFLSVASATINGAGAGITIGDSGANVVTIGTNSNTITLAKAATFSSTITVTDGLSTFISTSNTASNVLATNNTITTFGAAASSAGMLVVRSTSLTTGTAIRAQLAEGTVTTGKYFEAWDSVGVSGVFSVGAAGATVIAGSAFATAALTLTNGDVVVSSGKLLVTAASNAAAMAVFTNNTATSASVFKVAGSGVFTGTTTTSFVTITPSGLTTGTALYVVAVGATTSVGVIDVAVAGLTSGTALRITGATGVFTTGGKLIELTSTAAVAGNLLSVVTTGAYTGTGMIIVTAGAATTGTLVAISSTTGLTTGSLLSATSSTAGAIATNGAISLVASGAFTSTASTLGFVHVAVASTVTGTGMSILGGAMTTGIALNITDPSAGMTSGSLLRVISATAGAVATNGIVSFQSSAAFTSTTIGFLNVIVSGAVAGTGMALQMSAASQTTGIGFRVDQSNTTTGYTGDVVRFTGSSTTGQANTLSVVGVHTTLGNVVSITNASASQTGAFLLNVTQSGTTTGFTAGVVGLVGSHTTGGDTLRVTDVTTTTGNAISVISNALVAGTSTAVLVAHTTSVLGAGNSLVRISSTSVDTGTTTGVLLDLSSTAGAASTNILGTFAGLTTGIAMSLVATGVSTGVIYQATGAAANMTTGAYFRANDGSTNVFQIGLNGHIKTAGTAPSIAVTQQNGITAAAIAASNTDVCGTITTTGTNNNGGTTILTVTFTKAYAFAPKVMLMAANTSGAISGTAPMVTSTTTTFVVTIPASASSGATPSWHYMVMESGSST